MYFGGAVRCVRHAERHDCGLQSWNDFLIETSQDAAPFIGKLRLPGARPVALPQAELKVHLAFDHRSCAAGICRLPELRVSAELLDEFGVVLETDVLELKSCHAAQELFDNGFLLREHVGT